MKVKVKFIDALFQKTFYCSDVEVIKDNYVLFDEDDTVWLTGTYDPKRIQCKIYKRDSVIPVRELYEGLRVDRQGRRVVARYFEEGQLIAKGTAKCHKDDKFDLRCGTMIATERLFSKLSRTRMGLE